MPDNKYIVSDSNLTAFADAIRRKSGFTGGLEYPDGFIGGIESIPSTSDVVVKDVIDAQGDVTRTYAFGDSPVTREIDGVMPFDFVSSQASTPLKMIRAGKVVQDGTPSPASPISLDFNYGTFVMIDEELPVEYKRITGIKFDGDFHYDTGEVLTGEDDVTMTLANTSTSGQNVFGSYNGTGSGTMNFSLYLYGGGSTSNSYFRYGGQLVRPRFGSNERTITFGKSGTSGFTTDVSVTPTEFTTVATAYIGMLPNSSSPAYTGSIMGDILVGDRLRYIPCIRAEDGIIGYYEYNSGDFLEPSGTGTPIAGSYDYSKSYVSYIAENSEYLTMNNKTVYVSMLLAIGDHADEHNLLTGDVTRRCSFYAFDGTESWESTLSGMEYTLDADTSAPSNTVLCTHYTAGATSSSGGNGNVSLDGGVLRIKDTSHQGSVSAWTEYLAAQYAAGTPVIIIYPTRPSVEHGGRNDFTVVTGTNSATVVSSGQIALELELKFGDTFA